MRAATSTSFVVPAKSYASRRPAIRAALILDMAGNRIRAAVRAVLEEPHYQQRARQVQAELQALPGPEHGVELLEQLVAGRPQCTRGLEERVR